MQYSTWTAWSNKDDPASEDTVGPLFLRQATQHNNLTIPLVDDKIKIPEDLLACVQVLQKKDLHRVQSEAGDVPQSLHLYNVMGGDKKHPNPNLLHNMDRTDKLN